MGVAVGSKPPSCVGVGSDGVLLGPTVGGTDVDDATTGAVVLVAAGTLGELVLTAVAGASGVDEAAIVVEVGGTVVAVGGTLVAVGATVLVAGGRVLVGTGAATVVDSTASSR